PRPALCRQAVHGRWGDSEGLCLHALKPGHLCYGEGHWREGTYVPDLLKSMETLNLLELVEACGANAGTLAGLSVCGDESPPVSPMDLSLCTDEGSDGTDSDLRLKTDIEQIGTTVYGLPLYHFRYKTGPERFEGV